MFIGRKSELEKLNKYWEKTSAEAQFIIMYGRRRVGKTELIKEFMNNKEHSYYLAVKTNSQDQFQAFTKQILTDLGFPIEANLSFSSWQNFFDILKDRFLSNPKPRLIVVDEFPYLVNTNDSIPSMFQYGWDECLKDTNTMLVLLGSSVNMMIKHTMSYSSPLYGRRTGHFEIKPFDFNTSKQFFKTEDFETNFSLYSVLSGIPAYLKKVENESFEENLKDLFLKSDSFFASEPELLLAEEFNESANFMTVLKAIGFNQTKYSEILNSTSLDTNQLPFYLKTLLNLRLIEKLTPITDKNPEISKKGKYVIKDRFLRFYFSFILPNASQIQAGGYKSLLNSKAELLRGIIAKSYEEESLEFILKGVKNGKLPEFYKLGRWWDKNNEIDLIGLNEETNSILFTETKWTNQKVDIRILRELQKKSVNVEWGKQNRAEYFGLISKSGFTSELLEMAKTDSSLFLIEKDEIYS